MDCPICGCECAPAQTRHAETCDRVAFGVRPLRLLLEMRANGTFGVRAYLDAMRSAPESGGDKLCPFCRTGHVSRSSARVLYLDAILRAMGMARQASHTARRGRSAILEAFVDGSADTGPGRARRRTRDGIHVADWS